MSIALFVSPPYKRSPIANKERDFSLFSDVSCGPEWCLREQGRGLWWPPTKEVVESGMRAQYLESFFEVLFSLLLSILMGLALTIPQPIPHSMHSLFLLLIYVYINL